MAQAGGLLETGPHPVSSQALSPGHSFSRTAETIVISQIVLLI